MGVKLLWYVFVGGFLWRLVSNSYAFVVVL